MPNIVGIWPTIARFHGNVKRFCSQTAQLSKVSCQRDGPPRAEARFERLISRGLAKRGKPEPFDSEIASGRSLWEIIEGLLEILSRSDGKGNKNTFHCPARKETFVG
jgi:hypothetical protein